MWHLRDFFFLLNYSNNNRESGVKHRNQRNKWSKKEVLSDARKGNAVQKSNSSPRVGIRQLQQMTAQRTTVLSKVTKHQDVCRLGLRGGSHTQFLPRRHGFMPICSWVPPVISWTYSCGLCVTSQTLESRNYCEPLCPGLRSWREGHGGLSVLDKLSITGFNTMLL